MWLSHTLASCHRSGAFIFVTIMFPLKSARIWFVSCCIMLYDTIIYHIISYHIIPHFQTDPYHSAETTEGSPGCPSCLQTHRCPRSGPVAGAKLREDQQLHCSRGVTMGYHGLPWVTTGYHGLPRVTMGYHGLPWVTMGCHSTQHDPTSLEKKT